MPINDNKEEISENIPESYSADPSTDLNTKAFQKLVSKKYLYPLEKIHKHEWLKEL